MASHPEFMKSLSTLITVSCACVTLSASIAAQTTAEKAPQFGSSLKRPNGEISAKTEAQPRPKNDAADLPSPEDTIRVDTSLVVLDVIVTDTSGSNYITGLTKDDFTLIEDDQLQTVNALTLGDDTARLPRSIILIFDRSDSELPYLEASIEAAKTLVGQLKPSDEMAIVTDDVELARGFTKDKKKLKQTLDSLKTLTLTGFKTRSMQFSALLATLRELIDTHTKRPIIIFQTDGDEVGRLDPAAPQRQSNYDMDTVYSEVEKSHAKLYTVVPGERLIGMSHDEVVKRVTKMLERTRLARAKYGDMWYGYKRLPPTPQTNPTPSPLATQLAAQLLKLREGYFDRVCEGLLRGQTAAARVADLTGGWTSFLETPEQANGIYDRILADINHRYVLSYYPTNKEPDGKLRKLRIEVRGHPDYLIRGRTSYYAVAR
jgi:VWFA-related protein